MPRSRPRRLPRFILRPAAAQARAPSDGFGSAQRQNPGPGVQPVLCVQPCPQRGVRDRPLMLCTAWARKSCLTLSSRRRAAARPPRPGILKASAWPLDPGQPEGNRPCRPRGASAPLGSRSPLPRPAGRFSLPPFPRRRFPPAKRASPAPVQCWVSGCVPDAATRFSFCCISAKRASPAPVQCWVSGCVPDAATRFSFCCISAKRVSPAPAQCWVGNRVPGAVAGSEHAVLRAGAVQCAGVAHVPGMRCIGKVQGRSRGAGTGKAKGPRSSKPAGPAMILR